MPTGAITSYMDVPQIALYAFWIFFAGLIFYLRREDRREGYPLERDPADRSGRPATEVLPLIPGPKTFLLAHGGTATSGRGDRREPAAERLAAWPGAPFQPAGDPMRACVGPGSYAERADVPELTFDGEPNIVPLRVATDMSVAEGDPDPRGMEVVAADRRVAGVVRDLWVDRAEPQVRYLEVELTTAAAVAPADATATNPAPPAPGGQVLLPIYFSRIRADKRRVDVGSILAAQFAGVPRLKNPDQVTKLEEDKITAYYAAGKLYAEPRRSEPLL